jgi:hypothetical protein
MFVEGNKIKIMLNSVGGFDIYFITVNYSFGPFTET